MLLSRLRRARWVHVLQLLVFTFWVLNPFPGALSYWTDTNGDGVKEEVANPAEGDSWWDSDSDGDGLQNSAEALFGSDPYQIDADFDGLTDLIERDYADPLAPFDPWNWDSDGDGFSDHDEYYQSLTGWQPQINYLNLPPGGFYSYADADGDGTKNPEDYDFNLDRDNDGTVNWLDGAASFNGVGGMYMDDVNNGVWTDPGVYIGGNWYPGGTIDSDMDGTPDHLDVFPWGSFTYNGVEYGGAWQDSDSDGIPDVADMYPNDSSNGMGFTYNGNWYSGSWQDSDGDGVPDVADSWPYDANNGNAYGFWFNNTWYFGSSADSDNDGVPDVADSHSWDINLQADFDNDGRNAADDSHPDYSGLWSDWNFNWSNHDTDGDEDGVPDARDSHPRESWRSSDWNNDGGNDDSSSDFDGDGHAFENDSHPGDGTRWSDWDFNGTNNDGDGDEDGHADADDSHPRDAGLWSDWNGNGSNNDVDGDEDGAADAEDSHPRFSGLHSDWNGDGDDNDSDGDEDGIANGSDSHPRDSALSSDGDGDGRNEGNDSDPQNNQLWSDWNRDGSNNDADGDEDGWADGNDSHPRQNSLWNDFDGDNVNADQDSDPQDNQLWSDWNHDGTNNDADWDEDGRANDDDSSPYVAALWSDWDQNGVNNDSDGDEDGAIDTLDSHPRNAAFWGDWNYDGSNDTPADNADNDARDNSTDSDPLNAALWSDWNHDGDNNDADADEDGYVNADDSHPFDPALSTDWNGDGDDNEADVDEDGRVNEHTAADGSLVPNQDSHPRNANLWSDWDGNGVNNDEDGDEDGVLNENDSHPFHAHLWSDWNYNQTNNDQDGDEDGTQDSQDSDPRNASLRWDWNHDGDDNEGDWDEDGHDNGSDSHITNAALWDDFDVDGHNAEDDSDPADISLWSDWNRDGDNHATDGDEDGFGDIADSDPRNAALWIDWNHDGYNDGDEPPDRDGDGIFDNADDWPDDPYNNADTDMDGLIDYDEVFTHGTSREDVDSDDDFLTDYEELLVYHTNPLAQKSSPALPYTDYQAVDQTDSDNDQIPDRVEQWYADQGFGMNANDPNDAQGDLDGDGVSNLLAYLNGWSLVLYLDTYDADEDRITDALEDHWAAVAPGSLNKNVFADAVVDFDNDGVMNFEEITLRLNLAAASSGRVDGLSDIQVLALSETLTTRVLPGDCDGDGMSDVWEYRHTLDLRDASDAGAATGMLEVVPALMSWEEFVIAFDPSGVSTPTEFDYQSYTEAHAQSVAAREKIDADFDLLSNLREFQLGSHPRISDTDGDGWDDAAEMQAGSNVNLLGSTPLNPGGGTGTGGGTTGGTTGAGGSTNNTSNTSNTSNNTPPIITLAGRYNAVVFARPTPTMDEQYGTADETDRKAALEGEGFIDVTAGSDAAYRLVRYENGMPVYADWKLERGRPGFYSYEASGTHRSEPEPILSNEEIANLVEEGGEGPEIGGYLAFEPAEPNKSSSADAGGLGADRGSRTEGLATFQTGSWREFWLKASAAVPEAVSLSYLIRKTSGTGDSATEQFTSVTLTIPKGAKHSTQGGTNGTLKLHPAEGESMSLLPIDLATDLNNDGQITSADSSLREAATKSGASAADKEKGTEYMFINDKMSNGAWDADDEGLTSYYYVGPAGGYGTLPKPPASHKDDDDAEPLKVQVGGLTTGVVWFDHPAIDKLEFFKTRECKDSDKLNIKYPTPFDLSTGTLPETIYMRLRDDWAGSEQEGNLRMLVGKNLNETWAELRLPLIVVRDFGAKHFFNAIRDYIEENNTRLCIRDIGYPFGPNPTSVFRLCVMREEATQLVPVNALTAGNYGIEQVNLDTVGSQNKPAVIINGNQCFFSAGWREPVWNDPTTWDDLPHMIGTIADKCHGRLIRSGTTAAVSSDNFDNTTKPARGSPLAGPDPIPAGTLAGPDGIVGTADDIANPYAGQPGGKYVGYSSGAWTFAAGRAGGSDAVGGLSTNYGSTERTDVAHQLMGYAKGEEQGKGCIFTATQIKGEGSAIVSVFKGDASIAGVPALTPSVDTAAIKLFILDSGAGSLALMHVDPSGAMQNAYIGRKSALGVPYYVTIISHFIPLIRAHDYSITICIGDGDADGSSCM